MLKDLIISKVRVKLLQEFLSDPKQIIHVRDLVRRTSEEINAVRRELAHMEKAGMVKKEPRGNRVYYWFRNDYPLYNELISLVAKTCGIGDAILKNKNRLGRVSFVMMSGKFLRRLPRQPEDVDLLVVGDIVLPELSNLVRVEESTRGHEINYTVMSDEEFQSRVMIIGDEQELVE
jgi:DNA-binding transcriptional ArsR family regulator